jgi:hypothetical protein
MSNISDQKIVVVCDFSETMKDVIVHGVRIADILKKELCMVAFWKDKNQKAQVQEQLTHASARLQANLPGILLSTLLLQSSLRENMAKLVDSYNAVLIVLHQSAIKSGLKAFRESTIAFLFVNGSVPEYLRYKNILVPVDCRKASKEASLWPSYLGRFNQSMVHLVYSKETDPDQEKILKNNLSFIQKFFSNLNVRHRLIAGKSSSWGIFNETLNHAPDWNGDVMSFAGSTYISLIDLIIGLPEEKIVRKAGNLPILIINPRKDVCILCD